MLILQTVQCDDSTATVENVYGYSVRKQAVMTQC